MATTTLLTDADLIERAATVGRQIAPDASRHDVEGTFVEEGLRCLREAGLLALAVPTELGGMGATIRQVTLVQRELAHHCGSTALATSMHQHVVAFTAWRFRRGMPGAEGTLRRVADEGLLLVSTGGGDFTHPRGEATKVDGGYRVSGRKQFASQSSFGDVLSTMFVYEDPEQGRRVLNMAVPVRADGVTVLDNWDTLGMRGTASNDVVLEDVFVPEDKVLANRPYGVVDPPLQVVGSIAMPIISGVYLGVAEAAFAAAVAVLGVGRRWKSERNLSMKTPLGALTVRGAGDRVAALERCLAEVKSTLHCERVVLVPQGETAPDAPGGAVEAAGLWVSIEPAPAG